MDGLISSAGYYCRTPRRCQHWSRITAHLYTVVCMLTSSQPSARMPGDALRSALGVQSQAQVAGAHMHTCNTYTHTESYTCPIITYTWPAVRPFTSRDYPSLLFHYTAAPRVIGCVHPEPQTPRPLLFKPLLHQRDSGLAKRSVRMASPMAAMPQLRRRWVGVTAAPPLLLLLLLTRGRLAASAPTAAPIKGTTSSHTRDSATYTLHITASPRLPPLPCKVPSHRQCAQQPAHPETITLPIPLPLLPPPLTGCCSVSAAPPPTHNATRCPRMQGSLAPPSAKGGCWWATVRCTAVSWPAPSPAAPARRGRRPHPTRLPRPTCSATVQRPA